MIHPHGSISSELARLLSRSLPSAAHPNSAPDDSELLATLERFDEEQRAELAKFKRQQAAQRQREITRQNQMSAPPVGATVSHPTTSTNSQSDLAPETPTHITAQPKPIVTVPAKPVPSTTPANPPASPAVTTDPRSKNNSLPVSSQASSQRSAANSTVQAGNLTASSAASHVPTTSPSTTQAHPLPASTSQSSSPAASLAQPSGVASAQQYERHGMSTAQKIILAAGLLSSLFVLGYFVRWWQKRRRQRLGSPGKVDKLNIKGPFKKSQENLADTDSEPIFGGPGHASISFDHLQVLSEKPTVLNRSDTFSQPSPYHPPKSPSVTRSSLTIEPPRPQPNLPPNLNLISPLSQFNNQTPLDYRCKGPQMKGKTFVVERTYQATLADELVLHVGDRIEVAFYYDDGWCLGQNLDIERYDKDQLSKGVFPRDCVAPRPIEWVKDSEGSSTTGERGLVSHRTTYDDHADEENRKAFRAISSNPSLSPLSSSIFEKFPLPPRGQNRLEAQQRVSSLFIGRNAQLFLELDDALGDPESPHIHFAPSPNHLK
ncbi:hypothetical protein Pst134EA_017801 [Puccinia striiformis f. sp. tritici]|uniref:hypothetical protein n=2 Tax=Puccinia striiformis f. sp. tritici TaxID=168172 RepID=UPI002008AD0A|nr:hypothetical protein Pst134EA_017801 [Puccinia striiformis f. sp. tritici]KAH9461497.1 hypothetical protein Pst134EA_017801 [Puccinia striiformis f. sp. tritici]KAI9615865.1 hypothetical protein H4Q26_011116 [Puccinia striiformis f. sp. tritici PST-130]